MAEDKAKPEFPPILVIKKNEFEKAFKFIMEKMISVNKMTSSDLNEINKHLTRWLITGMNTVDSEKDTQNIKALNDLVEDLWKEFYRDLNLKVKKHRTKFRRKSII